MDPCERCHALQEESDGKTEKYLALVERQSLLFAQGYIQLAKEMDDAVRTGKYERERAVKALIEHKLLH